MPFPLTHLLVADELLTRNPRPDEDSALFILGSLAPDAVHYRKTLPNSNDMSGIGPMKKITHLCPISDEPWGKVTDNEGWIKSVKIFAKNNPGPLAEGYAVHALTDIYNNMTMWASFRTNHPQEAAKGYKSDYYRDLRNIDARLSIELKPQITKIFRILAEAKAHGMPGLVSADEIHSIQENILTEHIAKLPTPNHDYTFVTYDETLDFIQKAADFVTKELTQ